MVGLSLDLRGEVAVVTGGASGLGRAEAIALAARGATVVVVDINDPAPVVAEIRRHGNVATGATVDVGDPEGVESLFDRVLSEFGDLHVVVNNAGIVRDAMTYRMSLSDWDDVIAINLTATFLIARRASVHWREAHKRGELRRRALINTSSEAGLYGNRGQSNYAAAKAGVAALTLTLATELAPYGVDVNAIAPRARTAMSEQAFGELPRSETFDPFSPDHVAAIVVWLASASGTGISGQVLVVHGGGLELMEAWRCRHRLDREGPWSDEELGELRERLFGDRPTAHLTRPVAELFVEHRRD